MRRRFLQVALGILPALLLAPGLLGQHGHATGSAAHVGSSSPVRLSSPATHGPAFRAGQTGSPGRRPTGSPVRRPEYGRGGFPRRYPYFYNPYAYTGYNGIGPLGYGLDFADNQQDGEAPQQQQAAENAPPFRPIYQGQTETAPVHAQPTTTLIFKDGRPPMQVQNYALTATVLYALDGDTRREIPLSQLNVPATVAANQASGVDFALPVSR